MRIFLIKMDGRYSKTTEHKPINYPPPQPPGNPSTSEKSGEPGCSIF